MRSCGDVPVVHLLYVLSLNGHNVLPRRQVSYYILYNVIIIAVKQRKHIRLTHRTDFTDTRTALRLFFCFSFL